MEAFAFELTTDRNASAPPERRGLRRDGVRLMTLDSATGRIGHTTFYELDRLLREGDVVVLNASRTVPAVLQAERLRSDDSAAGDTVEIRLSHRLAEDCWEALVLAPDVAVGDTFAFSAKLSAIVREAVPGMPTHVLQFSLRGAALYDQIYALGEPVRYEYIDVPWALDYYQTVFAAAPGSVEMPSAGRAFSWQLLRKLQRRGVRIAFVELHAGLSYWPPVPGVTSGGQPHPTDNAEPYVVPPETADAVQTARAAGGRVIAVGTTVVRALETAAAASGRVMAGSGRTSLFIDAAYTLQAVDGLLTGFHEPQASHLELLSAFTPVAMLEAAYREAIEHRYLWHEFGDMHLILSS